MSSPFVMPGIQKVQVDSRLNPSYTFGRFIEGDCNRLARSASLAIAQHPGGTSFNPFLLYGGVERIITSLEAVAARVGGRGGLLGEPDELILPLCHPHAHLARRRAHCVLRI